MVPVSAQGERAAAWQRTGSVDYTHSIVRAKHGSLLAQDRRNEKNPPRTSMNARHVNESLTRVTKSYLLALGTTQISSFSPSTELSF